MYTPQKQNEGDKRLSGLKLACTDGYHSLF